MIQTRAFGRRNRPQLARPGKPSTLQQAEQGAPDTVRPSLLLDWGKYVAAIVLVLVVLATIRNGSGDAVVPATAEVRPAAAAKCGATLAEFYKLEIGMPYAAARDIIGCEGEILSQVSLGGTNSVMVSWDAQTAMFGSMNATFQNGRLVSRAQFRLK
ncbi:MAG TPA: hypothetical protein VGV07_07855 [Devosia sp.]|jgi:hypothetical protein|uniref:hypothetical protein n=1 Tax=Devosia sp. TaxID=1871048 RepID=UPI002DDCD414|nr:hypothetical protein [Devosia sp.]HEV2515148.1 hypothetical protein [Devosia sp.]